jgi:signal transduction histidine kinase
MRSRTTLGFVLIIGAVLACSITFLLTLAQNNAEFDNAKILRKVADQSAKVLDQNQPNWKSQLKAISGSQEVAERNITIIAGQRPENYNRGGGERPEKEQRGARVWDPQAVLWQSRSNLPPPPPRGNPNQSAEFKAYFEKYDLIFRGAGHGKFVAAIRPRAGVARDMARRRMDMLLMGGLVVLAVGVGAWMLVGLTLSPIRKLARQAASASAENLSVRLEPPSNDAEVVDLVDTLNGFLTRITETAESKGRFYAAASHELRTPLQALSGHLELALSRERPAEEYKAALEEAKKQSGRLKSLVQSLLLLHQLENNADRERDEVNVASICRAALQQMQPIVLARSLDVKFDVPANLSVSAISNHAEILSRNLVENAVKYAAEGKRVSIELKQVDGGKLLEIFNECEPVPGWSTDRAYEAFYRPDNARNARTGGNGLGLAICRAVAHADGWDLKVEQIEGGFLAQVLFPESAAKQTRGQKQKASPSVGPTIVEHPLA